MVREFEGATEKEAIERAIEELNLDRGEFDVEVVEEGKKGLFRKGNIRIKVYLDDREEDIPPPVESHIVEERGDEPNYNRIEYHDPKGKSTSGGVSTPPPPPMNDDPCGAIVLPVSSGSCAFVGGKSPRHHPWSFLQSRRYPQTIASPNRTSRFLQKRFLIPGCYFSFPTPTSFC